jgi:hypothetical protein
MRLSLWARRERRLAVVLAHRRRRRRRRRRKRRRKKRGWGIEWACGGSRSRGCQPQRK